MRGEKKGNRRHTTLSLLNADAKALCLRPDPELVKVFGIPQRHRSVESCPSAASRQPSVLPLIISEGALDTTWTRPNERVNHEAEEEQSHTPRKSLRTVRL